MVLPMPALKMIYTPVMSRRSEVVHATSLQRDPRKTACNKPCGGWLVAPAPGIVTCVDCKARLDKSVRRRRVP